jgi:signal transduction histidine kinase
VAASILQDTMKKRMPINKNRKCHDKCLEESLELQECLRQLTHRALATQEDDRKKISVELQGEIVQTLLGIKVRLLSLKQHKSNNRIGFNDELASVRRLVTKCAKSMRKFARDLAVTTKVPMFSSYHHSEEHRANLSLVRTLAK